MMKKWYFIVLLALLTLSCTRELEQEVPEEPEGYVEVKFTVAGDQMGTKALGESPNLNNMYVAVFGGSGYLKAYDKAKFESAGSYTDEHGTELPLYTYSFSLSLSNSRRTVHLLGNAPASIPFGRASDVLPSLLGEGETGFWQMISLPNVTAKQDSDGDYVYKGEKREPGQPYEPSESLQQAFTNIPLVRNWAKIELSAAPVSTSHFEPYSFAIINVPKKGTLVPYGGDNGFISDYKDCSFEKLRETYHYGGNMPSDPDILDYSIPSKGDFVNCTNGVKPFYTEAQKAAAESEEEYSVYMYERPVPDAAMKPTYVIVYGKYVNEEDATVPIGGVDCFYKVDLMEDGEYYPVLRNFRYRIDIQQISARGHDTPAAAAAAAGSADVSADINASNLPDISDGVRRMAVRPWMSKTFIEKEAKKVQLYVKFYNNIVGEGGSDPVPNLAASSVKYMLTPEYAGIVKDFEISDPEPDTNSENYGWREVSFAIADPKDQTVTARSQTIRIMCKTNWDDDTEVPLYRDIVVSLLPTQEMRVSCLDQRVLMVKGESQRVDIEIPDGLVESMFPLYFIIEDNKLTLTPDPSVEGNNLPVVAEKSIIDPTRQSFHFRRTLEWSEYNNLKAHLDYEDESLWRTFSSYFKTNCEESATQIYVENKYFYPAHTSFDNYASFKSPQFTTSIPRKVGEAVTVTAEQMSASQPLGTVYLDLVGLEPAEGSGISLVGGEYCYEPSTVKMTFNLKTTTDDGNVSVTLRSKDLPYEPKTVTPYHFQDIQLMDMATPGGTGNNLHTAGYYSQVAYGHVPTTADKYFFVGYYTDPLSPAPRVTIKNLKGIKGTDPTSYNDPGDTFTRKNYRERWFQTLAGTEPVSVTFSAVGYVEETVEAPRYKGYVYSWDFSSNSDWSTFITNGGFIQRDVTQNQVKGSLRLEISSSSEEKKPVKHDDSNGILLPRGGHYELDANIGSSNSDVYLYYAQIFYYVSGTTPLKPRASDVEPNPDGSIYYGYLGNNYEYMWNLPFGERGGKLTMDAPAGQDIVITRMILRGFQGVLMDSTDTGGGDIDLGGGLGEGGKL